MSWLVLLLALSFLLLHSSQATPLTLHKSGQGDIGATSRQLMKSQLQGGDCSSGAPFDDVANSTGDFAVGVHSITVSASVQFDSIQVTYILADGSLYPAPRHGRHSGTPFTILLGPDEYVESVEGKSDGEHITQLTFVTSGPEYEKKVYGPFGKDAPMSFSFKGYIFSFHGFSNTFLCQIGVYTLESVRKSEEYGGEGGDKFDDQTDFSNPPIVGVRRLLVGHGDRIDSIQAEYLMLGGFPKLGRRYGGDKGNITAITLDKGEVITGMEGKVGSGVVSELTIFTLKESGLPVQYGPLGKMGNVTFSIHGTILGFHGRAGLYMDRIGAYYI